MDKIDFVITWVDGDDKLWQTEFRTYLPQCQTTDDVRHLRYRNWENLRYWFRGVDKFAPWINKVHLITNGQLPDWLDLQAPRLHFVKHTDFIPGEYLPTFNSDSILLNLHRINGLSERFVLFDDDCFLIDKVEPKRFFRKGLPCDKAALNPLSPNCHFSHNILSDLCVINSSFNKYDVIGKHFWKWITPSAGSKLLRTLFNLPWPHFSGFYDHHLPQIFLKSTFDEVWEKHEDILLQTSASKFRNIADVTSWLFRYWQLAKGDFIPLNVQKDSAYITISDNTLDGIVDVIEHQKKKIVCLNDGDVSSFEEAKSRINAAFDKILPEKSSFEK